MTASDRAVAIAEDARVDLLDALDIGLDLVDAEQAPLVIAEARIANHGRAAAHQADGAVAGFLQPVEHRHRDQVADMDAGRRRIVADIAGDAFLHRQGVEALGIGDLVDEASLIEDVEEIGLELGGHRLALCNRPARHGA
jgi:hypothetical protein